jgi:protein-disulfide isomerase
MVNRIAFVFVALVLGCPLTSSAQDSQKLLATVDGQPIYEQDLMSVAGPSLVGLRDQEFKVKSDALNQLMRQKLIEAEAKKKGLTAEELVKQEVDSQIAEPSDDEAKGYYLAAKNESSLTFEEIKGQIKQLLRTAEIQQAREKYVESLRAKANVSVRLRSPKVEVAYDPARVRGDAKAPVTIVEFSDFQCPFCQKAEPILKDLLAKYNGRVKLAFLDFPMRSLHPQAQIAAEAARCADQQGKFWQYHDVLFTDQTKLDEAGLAQSARSLGLDENSFQSCLKSGKFKAQIEHDVQEGTQAGVAGTPAFFINGISLNGVQPEAAFEKIINTELADIGGGGLYGSVALNQQTVFGWPCPLRIASFVQCWRGSTLIVPELVVASLDRKFLGQAVGAERRSRSEAFSIRRLGGSGWPLVLRKG